jgi:hypothetical protein
MSTSDTTHQASLGVLHGRASDLVLDQEGGRLPSSAKCLAPNPEPLSPFSRLSLWLSL